MSIFQKKNLAEKEVNRNHFQNEKEIKANMLLMRVLLMIY